MNRRLLAFAALLAIVVTARVAGAAGPISFELPTSTLMTGSEIKLADLDGSGPDVLSMSGGDIFVRSNIGGGLGPVQSVPMGGTLIQYLVADLDGDGDRDLAGLTITRRLLVRLRQNGLLYYPVVAYNLPAMGNGLTAADLDGDGDREIAVSHADSAWVSVFPNVGGGTFGTPTTYPYNSPTGYAHGTRTYTDVVAGRFDADADLDIAIADHYPRFSVTVLFNQGDGTFAGSTRSPSMTGNIAEMIVADLDENGLDDLVIGHSWGFGTLIASGEGAFARRDSVGIGGSVEGRPAVADVNGDGHRDVLNGLNGGSTYNSDRNALGVFLGDGAGNLRHAYDVQVGISPLQAAAADLTGDGRADAFVVTSCANLSSGCSGSGRTGWLIAGGENGVMRACRWQTPVAPCHANQNCPVYGNPTWARVRLGAPSDLLIENGGHVTWQRNRGRAMLDPPVPAFDGVIVATRDLDGDGRDDILLDAPDAVAVQPTIGDALWGPVVNYPGGRFLALADFDGDGRTDLATVDGTQRMSVRPGNGAGGFGAASPTDFFMPVGDWVRANFGDADGDGRAEVIVNRGNRVTPDTIEVIALPPGGGRVTLATIPVPCRPGSPCYPGWPRLARSGPGTAPHLYVLGVAATDGRGYVLSYQRQPDGSYLERTRWETPRDPISLSIADFDLDGIDDAYFTAGQDCCNNAAGIYVFRGSANGTLSTVFSRYVGAYPYARTFATHLDGDSRLDLVVGLGAYKRMALLMNTTQVDQPTPTLLALVSADVRPGSVSLDWFGEAASTRVHVERRTLTSDWNAIADLVADGDGHFRHEDWAVAAGARYAYRLADDSGEPITEETWVDLPRASATTIESIQPNPVNGSGRVSFSLATGGPVRLDVLDVAGRRVASQRWDRLEAGSHAMAIPGATQLRPGLYLLRLVGTDGTHSRRFVSER